MDYSDYPRTESFFAGSEKKIGVLIDGKEWILKFQYNDGLKIRFNHVSEYIGSHIFGLLGFDVQMTRLGTYRGEQVVACRNFIPEGCRFVPFNDVGESTLELNGERFQYSYDDIMALLHMNRKITCVEHTVEGFWNVFIVDALLGNFDRHGSNWGFIKDGTTNRYRLAPVFDNGSCLYPQMADEDMMRSIMASEEQTRDRVFRFPTSQIKIGGDKSSYYEVISSMKYAECNEALRRIFPLIDLASIDALIDRTDFITGTHRGFYKHMIRARYELILKDTYRRLTQ